MKAALGFGTLGFVAGVLAGAAAVAISARRDVEWLVEREQRCWDLELAAGKVIAAWLLRRSRRAEPELAEAITSLEATMHPWLAGPEVGGRRGGGLT